MTSHQPRWRTARTHVHRTKTAARPASLGRGTSRSPFHPSAGHAQQVLPAVGWLVVPAPALRRLFAHRRVALEGRLGDALAARRCPEVSLDPVDMRGGGASFQHDDKTAWLAHHCGSYASFHVT